MHVALTLITVTFNASLVATVFAYALRARREDMRFMWHQPRLLALSLVAIFVLTPAVALVVVETIDVPVVAKVAIVALSLSIVPPLLPQKELAAGGQGSYAIGLTITSAVLAVAIIPLQVNFLGRLTDRPYGIPTSEVAGVVVSLVVLPLLAGTVFRALWPTAASRIGLPLTKIAGIATSVALLVVLVAIAPRVWDLISVRTVLAMVIFNLGALAVGHLLGGPDTRRSLVLGLSCATRHPAIALTIATVNYPGRNFAAAVVLCLAINGLLGGLYVRWCDRPVAVEHRIDA